MNQIVKAGEVYFVAYQNPILGGAGHQLVTAVRDVSAEDFFADVFKKIHAYNHDNVIFAFNRIGATQRKRWWKE